MMTKKYLNDQNISITMNGTKQVTVRLVCSTDPIYQPPRSGRIWHKVNF